MEVVWTSLVEGVWSAKEVVYHNSKAEEILHHDLGEGNQMCYSRSLQEAASVVIVCALRADRGFQGAGEQVYYRTVGYAKLAELENGVVGLEGVVGVVGLGQVLIPVTSCLPSFLALRKQAGNLG